MHLDPHISTARHVEIARPAVGPCQDVAGRRNHFRPHAGHACAYSALIRSITSGDAIGTPRTRDIDDRDVQRTDELSMAVGRHEHDRRARHGRGTGREVDDAGIESECGKERNASLPRCDPA